MMRPWLHAVLMLILVAARPAGAVLTDEEPSNNTIGTAAIQIVPTAAVTTDGGQFTLAPANDIDYLGIGSLAVGDIVTVSTTPLDDVLFKDPDTMIGLFTSGESRKCDGDDSVNNELVNFPGGKGSLCRFTIDSAGTWYVGVTGWTDPPFNGNHFESGVYELHVTINALVPPNPTPTPTATPTATPTPTPTPEPGMLPQLASGLLSLLLLDTRRRARTVEVNATARRASPGVSGNLIGAPRERFRPREHVRIPEARFDPSTAERPKQPPRRIDPQSCSASLSDPPTASRIGHRGVLSTDRSDSPSEDSVGSAEIC